MDRYGTRRYYNSANQLHCDEGPAVVRVDGTLEWYQNGRLHRADGPAIVYADDTLVWYQNGCLHRADGPAIVYADDTCEWWINGTPYTEQDYLAQPKALEQTP